MKKIILLFFAIFSLVAAVSCGDKSNEPKVFQLSKPATIEAQ